jgi:bilirubin oxidase
MEKPIMLISYAFVDSGNAIKNSVQESLLGGTDEGQQFKVLELRPQSGDFSSQKIPTRLNSIHRFNEADGVRTRKFILEAFTINSKMMDPNRVDEIVKMGDTEIWEVSNNSPTYHPFHIHGVQFLILDRDGKKPPAYEQGWKDTVMVLPQETVRLIMQFRDFSDPHLPYMYHCHILEHEDMGMMGQFVVVQNPSDDVHLDSPLSGPMMDHNENH